MWRRDPGEANVERRGRESERTGDHDEHHVRLIFSSVSDTNRNIWIFREAVCHGSFVRDSTTKTCARARKGWM